MRRAIRALFLFAAACVLGCAYLLPAAWRSFRADPDDAAPAITRALDARKLVVERFDQAKRQIETAWVISSSGVDKTRQRFVIRWERDTKEGTTTVYVRHQGQDQDIGQPGAEKWGATYHEVGQEEGLLDLIQKELGSNRGS